MTVAGVLSFAPAAGASTGTSGGGTAAGASGGTAAGASASAAAACPAPLHAYQYTSYTGGYKKFCKSDYKLSDNRFNNGGRVNDHIRSVKNLTRGCWWTLWTDYYNRGSHNTFKPWSWDANLSNNRVGYRTSSLYKSCP
ncbi:hypothetical protein GCM10009801_74380 [Streptomyces albiaxialis]|uniref:Uncharacterized protein n=1 Tax=Streptomyces albiaxialis TaxID=329523 RepID=A0ABN2WXP8_9ACTN